MTKATNLNSINVQLISYTHHKHPVLPYVCSVLQKMSKLYLPEEEYNRLNYFPYVWHTIDGDCTYQVEKISSRSEDIHVFGFSFYNWSTQRSVKTAKLLREKYPNALFVAGGPFIAEDEDTRESKHYQFYDIEPYFDIFVCGEGEKAWLDILQNVLDGKTGFVVGRRDPRAAAAKVMQLAKDSQLREKMGNAGRQRVKECFKMSDQIRAFSQLYQEILKT